VLSKYRDVIPNTSSIGKSEGLVDFDLEGPNSKTVERLSVLLIPIPGESEWSMKYFDALNTIEQQQQQQQQRQQMNSDRKRPSEYSNGSIDDDVNQRKKLFTLSSSNIDNNNNNISNDNSSIGVNNSINKLNVETDTSILSCLAKFYDSDTIEKGFRLNDMIEIIGIFSLESYDDSLPVSSEQSEYEQLYFGDSFTSNLPPCSVAPRVHCITFRRLGSSFPLLIEMPKAGEQDDSARYIVASKAVGPFTIGQPSIDLSIEKINIAREKVIAIIEKAIGGDRLLATYVMLAILSRVYARPENLVLGSLALNIIGFEYQDKRINMLKDALSLIVPRCSIVQADIETFNNNVFLPFKDYDKNIMQRSPLQLATGTVIIIDETNMKEGILNKQGIESVKALQSVVSKQVLPVTFANYEVKLPTDYSLILLSNSSPSLITSVSNDVIKIKIAEWKADEDMDIDNNSNALEDIRLWWSYCRLGDVKMNENMIKYAEDDFVKARQANDIPPSTFHTWLTIARLITISFGDVNMEPKHWDMMREMEYQRVNSIGVN